MCECSGKGKKNNLKFVFSFPHPQQKHQHSCAKVSTQVIRCLMDVGGMCFITSSSSLQRSHTPSETPAGEECRVARAAHRRTVIKVSVVLSQMMFSPQNDHDYLLRRRPAWVETIMTEGFFLSVHPPGKRLHHSIFSETAGVS